MYPLVYASEATESTTSVTSGDSSTWVIIFLCAIMAMCIGAWIRHLMISSNQDETKRRAHFAPPMLKGHRKSRTNIRNRDTALDNQSASVISDTADRYCPSPGYIQNGIQELENWVKSSS